MAKLPGVIRRGAGWNVMIRVNGTRHRFGPRTEPFLRDASRNEVEAGPSDNDRRPQAVRSAG